MAEEQVRACLSALGSDNGKTLDDETAEAFDQIEQSIQAYATANPGGYPKKPYEILIRIEVTAEGLAMRAIRHQVDVKLPKLSVKHYQQAAGIGGHIVTAPPAQRTLPLERGDTRGGLKMVAEAQ